MSGDLKDYVLMAGVTDPSNPQHLEFFESWMSLELKKPSKVQAVAVHLPEEHAHEYVDVILSLEVGQKRIRQIPLWQPPDFVEYEDGDIVLGYKLDPAYPVWFKQNFTVMFENYGVAAPPPFIVELRMETCEEDEIKTHGVRERCSMALWDTAGAEAVFFASGWSVGKPAESNMMMVGQLPGGQTAVLAAVTLCGPEEVMERCKGAPYVVNIGARDILRGVLEGYEKTPLGWLYQSVSFKPPLGISSRQAFRVTAQHESPKGMRAVIQGTVDRDVY